MTKLEKLNNELKKCEAELNRLYEKKKQLENEKTIEENKEIQKLLKQKNITLEDLKQLLN